MKKIPKLAQKSLTLFQRTRHIPSPLLIRMFFESDFLLLFGWVFFTIGSIIFCVFASLSDFSSLILSKDSPQTQAVIYKKEYANTQENRVPIYEYHYKFQVEGKEYTGISYGFSSNYQEGDTATVIYKRNKPTYSRIVNLRKKHFLPFFLIFIAIFPLIGGLVLAIAIPKVFTKIRILKEGVLGEASLVGMEPTNTTINKQRVMKMLFELVSGGKTYKIHLNTHQIHKFWDNKPQKVLFLPQEPEKTLIISSLPGNPEVSDKGEIVTHYKLFPAVIYLFFPAACLLAYWWAFSQY